MIDHEHQKTPLYDIMLFDVKIEGNETIF